MTKRETFAAAMATLGAAFDRKLSAAALEGYWLALEDLTETELAGVTKRALCESKFMPAPAELLAFAGKGARNLTAEIAEAWTAVTAAIRQHGYTVASIDFGPMVNTVLRCLGPWEWLCEQTDSDLVWRRKDFERFYEAFSAQDAMSLRPEALPGWCAGREAGGDRHVRVAIGGVTPARHIAGKTPETQSVVRKLADAASVSPLRDIRIPERPADMQRPPIKVKTTEEQGRAAIRELEMRAAMTGGMG